MKLSLKLLILSGLLFFGLNVFAQSVDMAGAKFNAANQQFKAKSYGQAVQLYEQALRMAKAAGPDAFSLQTQIEKQLAVSYFWNGIDFYKHRQFDQAIAQMQKAKQLADQIGDARTKTLSVTYIARVYSSKGMSMMKSKDYTGADAQFDAAIKEKPTCLNAYFGKSLLAKETKNTDEMIASVNKLGQLVAKSTNQKGPQMYGQVKNMAFATLLNDGAMELQREHPEDALTSLNKSLQFNRNNASAYYYIALANLKLKRWDGAISNAKKALTMNGVSKTDIYFTLGQAYQGKGEKASACSAFKKVTSGPNVAAAKYQIKQVLKCK
ncbi:MAG: hypothetical protein JXR71_06780 [Bacteroidales bacterium]|nr:hypothetical protein [Bacteroidales bacterium]